MIMNSFRQRKATKQLRCCLLGNFLLATVHFYLLLLLLPSNNQVLATVSARSRGSSSSSRTSTRSGSNAVAPSSATKNGAVRTIVISDSEGIDRYNTLYFGSSPSDTLQVSDKHWLIHYLDQLPKQRVMDHSDLDDRDEEDETNDGGKAKNAFKQEDRDGFVQAFHPDDYNRLTQVIQSKYLNDPRTNERMWGFVNDVSINHPFIFFHQRKAGGSSLRLTLYYASKKLNLPRYIACFEGVDCDMYHIAYKRPASVYAGHFRWGVQSDLARFGSTNEAKTQVRNQFSCATNYRNPIDRIESCLYFRFGAKIKSSLHPEGRACLMELPIEQFREVLYWIDEFGNSCLNEAFRIMSGFEEETVIDYLMDGAEKQQLSPDEDGEDRRRQLMESSSSSRIHREERRLLRGLSASSGNSSVSESKKHLTTMAWSVFNTTLAHAQRCSSLVLEIPESYAAVAHRIPTLGNAGGFVAETKVNVNHRRSECAKTTGEHRAFIREKAALEMMLYEAVYNKTKEKVQIQQNSKYFLNQCFHQSIAASSSKINSIANSSAMVKLNETVGANGNSSLAIPTTSLVPPVIVSMNNIIHRQFQAMLQSITRKSVATLIDSNVVLSALRAAKSSPPSRSRSNRFKKSTPASTSSASSSAGMDPAYIIPTAQCPTIIDYSLSIVEASYFRLHPGDYSKDSEKAQKGKFDRSFYLSSDAAEKNSCSSNANNIVSATTNGNATFERMAILIKDPFVQIFLQAFVGPDNGNKMKKNESSSSSSTDQASLSVREEVNRLFQVWLTKRETMKKTIMDSLIKSIETSKDNTSPSIVRSIDSLDTVTTTNAAATTGSHLTTNTSTLRRLQQSTGGYSGSLRSAARPRQSYTYSRNGVQSSSSSSSLTSSTPLSSISSTQKTMTTSQLLSQSSSNGNDINDGSGNSYTGYSGVSGVGSNNNYGNGGDRDSATQSMSAAHQIVTNRLKNQLKTLHATRPQAPPPPPAPSTPVVSRDAISSGNAAGAVFINSNKNNDNSDGDNAAAASSTNNAAPLSAVQRPPIDSIQSAAKARLRPASRVRNNRGSSSGSNSGNVTSIKLTSPVSSSSFPQSDSTSSQSSSSMLALSSLSTSSTGGRLPVTFYDALDEWRYKHLYSLFFTQSEYVSFFQSSSPVSLKDVRSKVESQSLESLLNSATESGKYSKENYQFFAYEVLIDEVYQYQMKTLLVDYQEINQLSEFYHSKDYQTAFTAMMGNKRTNEDMKSADSIKHGKAVANSNKEILQSKLLEVSRRKKGKTAGKEYEDDLWWKLLVFTQQWSEVRKGDDETKIVFKKLRCAFGSASHLIDQDLVMKVLPTVKLFYAEYPEILMKVKEIVKESMAKIGMSTDQMHFMYDLN